MKLIGAIIALSLALAALYISQVAAGYACDEQVPCTSGSRPHAVRLLAGVGLAGVVALLVLAARYRARGALLVGMLTAALYVVWLVLIVEQIEGSPPSVSFGSVSVPA